MATIFHQTRDNVEGAAAPRVTVARASGGATITVNNASLLATTFPFYVTPVRGNTALTILEITAAAGNVLTTSGPAPGKADAALQVDDRLEIRNNAAYTAELQAAVNAAEDALDDHETRIDTLEAGGGGGVFIASGSSHASGLVPDPGSAAGTARFLREDATFAVPAATVAGGTSGRVALVGVSGVVTDSAGVNFDAPSSTLNVIKGVGGGRSCLGLESGGTRWGVGLGDEAIAHFYVGARDSLTANWFWRANWNDGSIPGNTFRVASGQDGVTTVGIEAVAGQTSPLMGLLGPSSAATARAVAYLDAGFNVADDASFAGFGRLDAAGFNGREYGLRIDATGSGANAAFFGPGGAGSYGGGVGCVFLPDRTTAPTTDPVGGGLLYAESGQPVWRDPAGTVTTLTAGIKEKYRWGASGTITAGQKPQTHYVDVALTAYSLEITASAGTVTAQIEQSTNGGGAWTAVDSIALASGISNTKAISASLAAGTLLRVNYTAASGCSDPLVTLLARNT